VIARGIDGFHEKLHRFVDGTKRDVHAPDMPGRWGHEVLFAAPKLFASTENTIIKRGIVADCRVNAPLRCQPIAIRLNRSEGIMKRFTAALVGPTAMTCLAAPSFVQQLRAAGQDVPPWAVHVKNSTALSGVVVDLTNAIAKDAGLQTQYQVMTFADLIPAVISNKIDIIATEMAITRARAEQVDFSIPVYTAPREALVVLASDATAYKTLADIKDLPVGVQKGSIQMVLLQKTGGFSQLKIYDTVQDVWAAVASG
jgi:hypothetical protein